MLKYNKLYENFKKGSNKMMDMMEELADPNAKRIVLPSNPLRVYWSMFLFTCTLYILLIIPYRIDRDWKPDPTYHPPFSSYVPDELVYY